MFKFPLVILMLLVSLVINASGYNTGMIKIDGLKRQFVIKKPPNWNKNKKFPLIIALHGGGSSWRKFNNGTTKHTLDIETNKQNIIYILPQAINKHWNDGRGTFSEDSPDDVEFISQLISFAIDKYKVDPKKIYIVGMSNGGMMAIRLAIELSDKIKAVAAVSALLNTKIRFKEPKKSVSFLLIHGTEDPVIPFKGGDIKAFSFTKSRGKVVSARKTIDYFLNHNVCSTRPIKTFQDKRPFDKTSINVELYNRCYGSSQVELIQVNDGGHAWPGGKQYLPVGIIGRASREINAGKVIVNFFLSLN